MSDFAALTTELIALQRRAAPNMLVAREGPEGISLNAPWAHPTKPKEPMWFGGVKAGKAYVSYHLMPVYTHPALAASISPALKKRMQGKSCFNFQAADPALFEELEALTREAAALYAAPFKLP
jgi:hypothetical protein